MYVPIVHLSCSWVAIIMNSSSLLLFVCECETCCVSTRWDRWIWLRHCIYHTEHQQLSNYIVHKIIPRLQLQLLHHPLPSRLDLSGFDLIRFLEQDVCMSKKNDIYVYQLFVVMMALYLDPEYMYSCESGLFNPHNNNNNQNHEEEEDDDNYLRSKKQALRIELDYLLTCWLEGQSFLLEGPWPETLQASDQGYKQRYPECTIPWMVLYIASFWSML